MIAKLGVRERKVGVQSQIPVHVVIIGPFDTVAAARSAGLGGARVSNEYQFGINIQPPKGDGALQALESDSPNTDLCAIGLNERIGAMHDLSVQVRAGAGHRINAGHDTASIVAVIAQTSLEV